MNGSLANTILNFLMPLFSSWGYVIVFAGIFLESIFLTGWIAPGSTVLLLGSFYAAQGQLNIVSTAVIGVLAAFLGDNVGFFLGARYGKRLLDKYRDHKRMYEGLEKTQSYFRRYGGATVLFGRMISGIDAFIPLFAGLGGMRYRKYVAFDIPGIFLWVAMLCTLGYLFGDNWEAIDRFFGIIGWGLLALVLAAVAVYFLIKRRRKA